MLGEVLIVAESVKLPGGVPVALMENTAMVPDPVFATYRVEPLGSIASPFGLKPVLETVPRFVSTPALALKATMDPSFPTCPPVAVT
jgi:hypothetical protein